MIFKLIREILKQKITLFCLDITGEYKNRIGDFEPYYSDEIKKKWGTQFAKISDARKRKSYGFNQDGRLTNEECEKIENECFNELNKITKDRIIHLREGSKPILLELTEISNTKKSLEATQCLIEGILEYAKETYENNSLKQNEKDEFRCCIVLEEAHTLVPENIGIGGRFSEYQALVDKLSQIALQGRKYNVGFILVSQGTATVKKTVLNQCNTMISFRAYDETSFNFLSSYFGDEYVKTDNSFKK